MRIQRGIWALLFALAMLAIPPASSAGVFVSVTFAPPALPVYVQPACPGDGYIWTPGYWAYGPDGYYWVPGTWVMAPEPGLLWTPGYWGWGGSAYMWHAGYWGPTVGFYGGIDYGFGYTGVGYAGGYWRDRHFYYNRSVNNVRITNVHIYNRTVVNERVVNRVSYNGGRGGIDMRPTHEQEMAEHQHHFEATSAQERQRNMASSNRALWASQNHGRPSIAATARPGEFSGHGVVGAREAGAPYHGPANAPGKNGHAVPRPGNEPRSNMRTPQSHPMEAPHNEAPHNQPMQHNNVPRPPNTPNRMNAPRTNEMHGQNVPHPSGEVHHENQARPMNQPRNVPRPENRPHESAPHGQNVPHPENRPHESAPRQSAPHPENRPHESAPHAQHESHPPKDSHGHGGGKGGRH